MLNQGRAFLFKGREIMSCLHANGNVSVERKKKMSVKEKVTELLNCPPQGG